MTASNPRMDPPSLRSAAHPAVTPALNTGSARRTLITYRAFDPLFMGPRGRGVGRAGHSSKADRRRATERGNCHVRHISVMEESAQKCRGVLRSGAIAYSAAVARRAVRFDLLSAASPSRLTSTPSLPRASWEGSRTMWKATTPRRPQPSWSRCCARKLHFGSSMTRPRSRYRRRWSPGSSNHRQATRPRLPLVAPLPRRAPMRLLFAVCQERRSSVPVFAG